MGIMLGAHPSNSSMNERRPGAGSNGWNAAFRMRWWLEIIREDGDPTNKRKLHRMKVTGAHNDRKPIDLVVGEGGWLELVGGATARAEGGTLGEGLAKMEDDNQWFLDQLVEREAQGRPLAPGVKSPDYAPKALAGEYKERSDGRKPIAAVKEIMDRLFKAKRSPPPSSFMPRPLRRARTSWTGI